MDELARQAEGAAAQRNMKEIYDITKKLSGKFQHGDRPIKDKDGNSLKDTDQQLAWWAEHFKELLNRPPLTDPQEIEEAENDLDINCEKPSKEEIKVAIKQTRKRS